MEKVKDKIKQYWDWRSTTYFTDRSEETEKRWRAVLNNLVSESTGRRALDIGTGRGHFAFYLSGLGFDVTGVDISENMISMAGQEAKARGLDIDFRTGDAETLDFEDHTFDVVVSRNLLWTLPDPEKAFSEWRRVLKPGGTLVVSDGSWMNLTWRRIHHLGLKLIREKLKMTSLVSLRFFLSYAGLMKCLPFYEGICFENASTLLQAADFKEIKSYDTSGFNPYKKEHGKKVKDPDFFIAWAKA